MIVSIQGYERLRKELDHLKKIRRPEIAERINASKEYGDLSENAEYHDAKEEQAFVEGRIIEIEHILKTADVVHKTDSQKIGVGSTVTLLKDRKQFSYEIVGATEADPFNGKVSIESPLGQALLDRTVGNTVTIQTPTGEATYAIKDIR